ncbi:MAG: Uncharacterised protein [Opitutia bacterium UBA7350]|nr:MAG: Uncharacterised protein [Opitutae bacterium UBA7350]
MSGTFFYDGDCGLCTRAVAFLKQRDHQQCLKFCSLQSPEAQARLPLALTSDLDTAVFVNNQDPEKFQLRSDAVLSALIEIGGFWRFLARLAACIPLGIRNRCYNRIAANRHRCHLPKE